MERHLHWDGCRNVRDLGGLGPIRRGALVRADALERLTADGWAALEQHGIRTVIDLRNPDEIGEDDAPRPETLTTIRIPLDGLEHRDFWQHWYGRPEFGTPHYYGPWLERFPQRAAAVLTAIARAEPGGVAYHCGIGRDRTGLITMLVLAALDVPHETIVEDYALSESRVPPCPELDAFWAEQDRTAGEVLADTVATVDPARYLEPGDLAALKVRLVTHARPANGYLPSQE
jgi:protein-tyrosine phosphatase